MKTKVISIFLIFIFLFSCSHAVTAATIDELNKEKEEINSNINDTKEQKKEVEDEKNKELQEVYELAAKIEESENEIKQIEAQLTELENNIATKTKLIEKRQKEYEANKELLETRLAVMYESGETSFLEILFKSASIVEFLSNYYNFNQIIECDKELLTNIEKQKIEIEQAKVELENEKAQVEKLKQDKEAAANKLKVQKQTHQEKVNALTEEQKALQSEIDAANQKLKNIEAEITKELKRIEEERKAAEAKSGGSGSTGIYFDGSFIWPCDGRYITSTVKARWGRQHKGIDIGIDHQNVYATASGYAYTLNNPGGYGYYIIIIHGNNYISLYGHLSSYKVSYGQYVTQGQVIGISGGRRGEAGAGSSTGAHLHFEIRRASSISSYFSVSPLNPLDYLPGGYTLAPGAATPS